ncbi:MAG: FeS assembly SUF system protein [Flavobacteriaceae bacterium]|nr:MAG: FeS assembly SUF system protein [Flavobacteriaceae bacterium]
MSLSNQEMAEVGDKIVETLKTIFDPEIPVDIYELGLIYDVQISEEGFAKITMTLTTPNCPVAESLPKEVSDKVKAVDKVSDAEVILTFEPPWEKTMMSEEAMFQLGML